jgi:hypothetical protein
MKRNARFHYVLEPVLLTRQWSLDALQLKLERVNHALTVCQEQLTTLQEDIVLAANEWKVRAEITHHLRVDQFAVMTRYMHDLAIQRLSKEQALAELGHARDILIDQVVAAQCAVDMVEDHRDRMKAQFIKLRSNEACKNADDQWSILQARR